MGRARKPRIEVLVVGISFGIITMIDENGEIKNYRQRGISRVSVKRIEEFIKMGLLDARVKILDEFPGHYKAYVEDEYVMEKPVVTFKVS